MRVENPVALGRIHWRMGDAPVPAPNSCIASTAVFILGRDEEVLPDWPAGGEHFSAMIELQGAVSAGGDADASVDFLARSAVTEHLHEGARFLFMAGRDVLAEVEITKVLWQPQE